MCGIMARLFLDWVPGYQAFLVRVAGELEEILNPDRSGFAACIASYNGCSIITGYFESSVIPHESY